MTEVVWSVHFRCHEFYENVDFRRNFDPLFRKLVNFTLLSERIVSINSYFFFN